MKKKILLVSSFIILFVQIIQSMDLSEAPKSATNEEIIKMLTTNKSLPLDEKVIHNPSAQIHRFANHHNPSIVQGNVTVSVVSIVSTSTGNQTQTKKEEPVVSISM